ncbi:MAG TPA: AbrB/MazE/SpoVT family DNA-binding domain-containing protein [Candidatus Tectomicrobia bacterium]|nr:AbrB/MazE/SpoVT family DNA-binding domain-containing protein [Candidatus Tectomicrobia bacterium]
MAKVTSKLQVTIPKAIAERFGIKPGDEIQWIASGDTIRVVPPNRTTQPLDLETRLKLFDAATARQRQRQRRRGSSGRSPRTRGWTREDLYVRGRAH